MKVLVGCPVSNRSWILPTWKRHVDACHGLEEAEFIFVASYNDPDIELLKDWGEVAVTAEKPRSDRRHWEPARIRKMVEVRNHLLAAVRDIKPDYFLSLDSDILIHPEAFQSALELLQPADVWSVGLKCFMTPDSYLFPSNALRSGRYERVKVSKPVEVDIIMGAKLMKPEAYNIDYEYEKFGEDGGWSKAVKDAGGRLIWDGRISNKHVMTPELLDQVDERIGW